MDWQAKLITLYLSVCAHYRDELWAHNQRMAPYANLRFTDEEVIVIYLFGIIDKKREVKTIYEYANRHLRDWFPHLPGYHAYVQRLNQVADVFPALLEKYCVQSVPEVPVGLVDSMPIILARHGRRFNAKVAPELANSGYCPTKKLYYYGVKVHIIGDQRAGTLPDARYIGVTPAQMNDGKALEQVAPALPYHEIYGDKAYEYLTHGNVARFLNFDVLTPVKKQKGQERLDSADCLFSSAVSRIRQPIESLFGWIEEKTGIEYAAKVRSYRGLLVHVFGRLAAAMFLWNFL